MAPAAGLMLLVHLETFRRALVRNAAQVTCRAHEQGLRAPEENLQALPEFPFDSHYRHVDGLRLAHLDEGEGPPVVFFHGEPTWSFLWRKVIPPVRDAGFRCLAPDLAGFGRSDKPTDIDFYSYDRHCALAGGLLEDLDVRGATVVVHDQGGPIGLRLAVEQRERIDHLVILDTGEFNGHRKVTEAWIAFRDFVGRTEDLPVGLLVRRGCKTDPGEDVAAAYEAPYPNSESKAGAQAFPLLVPLTPDAPGARAGQRVHDSLKHDRRPTLMLWADSDSVFPPAAGERFAESIGRDDSPRKIEDAGHFLQEDQGHPIGALIADWLTSG